MLRSPAILSVTVFAAASIVLHAILATFGAIAVFAPRAVPTSAYSIGFTCCRGESERAGSQTEQRQPHKAQEAAAPEPDLRELLIIESRFRIY
jgi:hypothetical protein